MAGVIVCGTFTIEPIVPLLRFWIDELALGYDVEASAYAQVFQELVNHDSRMRTNAGGFNVLLVRLEDWGNAEAAARTARELVPAVRAAAEAISATLLVAVMPPRPSHAAVAAELCAALRGPPNVEVLSGAEVLARHPGGEYDDPAADAAGHIPYTSLFYTTLATAIARVIHRISIPAPKVIVLDCDQTLWSGVCGEDGAHGVVLDPARLALQEFFLARQRAGLLLCIASRNSEADVRAVFELRNEMPLRLEHFAATRIDWGSKSESLRSLAGELGVGLDTFVFVDDDPVVCAEVEAAHPEVVTLQLPAESEAIERFLDSVWALDLRAATKEDAQRTAAVQANTQRDAVRERAPTFAEFLASLELHVRIAPARQEDLARVAQLTQRTNQFNTTTVRRTQADIERLLRSVEREVVTVHVTDRFGDYGLVGVAIYGCGANELEANALVVDALMLSCRVLGRGVEHQLLAWLGSRAFDRGLARVDIAFAATPKNAPVEDFLEHVGTAYARTTEMGRVYELPVVLARATALSAHEPTRASRAPGPSAAAPRGPMRGMAWTRTAMRFAESTSVLRAARGSQDPPSDRAPFVAPRNRIDEWVANTFIDLLGVDRVGVEDDFLALGGDSLQLVRLTSRIQREFGVHVDFQVLYEAASVRVLSEVILASTTDSARVEEGRHPWSRHRSCKPRAYGAALQGEAMAVPRGSTRS
jgi:FkbH-like protein